MHNLYYNGDGERIGGESRSNRAVFGAVLYRQARMFFPTFLTSILKQTAHNFDLLFVNDDLATSDLNQVVTEIRESGFPGRIEVIKGEKRQSIADFRIQMILRAKIMRYSLLIIGDCDDSFSHNRVETSIHTFKKFYGAAFFYNNIVGKNETMLMQNMPEQVCHEEELSQYNFLGMSNTAINLDAFDEAFIESLYEGSNPIFDWYLYSRILLSGLCGVKVSDAYTKYNLYDGNAVGILGNTLEELAYEKVVKQRQYQLLKSRSPLFSRLSSELANVEINEAFYLSRFYRRELKNYWWEKIRLGD